MANEQNIGNIAIIGLQLRADGILFPKLQQALTVGSKANGKRSIQKNNYLKTFR